MQAWIPLFFVAVGLGVGSFTDVIRFKVYNVLTIPLFVAGLLYHTALNGGSGFGFSVGGAGLGLAILLIPYLMGGLGAGDVKFVMAIGAWIGASLILPSILLGSLVVLLYHFTIVARKTGFVGLTQSLQLMLLKLSSFGRSFALNDQFESVQSVVRSADSPNRGRLIPFSAMMSIGIVAVVAINWWIHRN